MDLYAPRPRRTDYVEGIIDFSEERQPRESCSNRCVDIDPALWSMQPTSEIDQKRHVTSLT